MKSVKRTSQLTAGAACALAVMAGAATAKEMTFGYVTASMMYPYDVATAEGFKEEAAAVGAKAVVIDPQAKVEQQGNAIDDLIGQQVDGIGILPLDSTIAESFVDRIAQKNIPAVSVALQVGDPTKRKLRDVYPGLTALVAPDDVIEGEQAAKLALRLLPKDRVAKIAIIEGAPGYAVVQQRSEGFKKGLDEAGAKYQIVGSQPTDWTPERGEAVCQNFLTTTPDLDLIFSQADDMALGCARAISSLGSNVKLVATSGGSKLGNAAIQAGELDGSVCVKPKLMGRLMFKALYAAATKKNTEKGQFITIDLPIITKDTVAQCPAEW